MEWIWLGALSIFVAWFAFWNYQKWERLSKVYKANINNRLVAIEHRGEPDMALLATKKELEAIQEMVSDHHESWIAHTRQISVILNRLEEMTKSKEAWNRERAEQLLYAWNAARAFQPQVDRIDRDIKVLQEADGLSVQRLDKLEAEDMDMRQAIRVVQRLYWEHVNKEGEQGSDESQEG